LAGILNCFLMSSKELRLRMVGAKPLPSIWETHLSQHPHVGLLNTSIAMPCVATDDSGIDDSEQAAKAINMIERILSVTAFIV